MLLNIPDSVIENQIIPQFVQIAVTEFEKRMRLVTKTIELPPFSNKETVKEVLGIGDAKLNSWIDQGLKIQVWSKQDIRIRREALQQFLVENFEV
jgi:signal transduction histidine kinase